MAARRSFTEEEKAYIRERARGDSFYFAREILGYKDSLVEWRDESGRKCGGKKEGEEYGISPVGEHATMVGGFNSPSRRVLLQAPRSSYKSTVATAWIVQQIAENRNVRVLYSMETYHQAQKKLRSIKAHFEENELLREVYGEFVNKNQWSNTMFTVAGRTKIGLADPTVTAGAVGTNLTGAHFDIVILDDIVTFDNVRTQDSVEKIREYFGMVEPLLDPGGKMMVVGTRYSDGDLYGDIEREMSDEFEIIKIDCGFDIQKDGEGKVFLAPKREDGKPAFVHLTKEVLESKLRTMGTVQFSSQYLNKCLSADAQIFFRKHFKVMRWQPWMKRLRGYILTDTAVAVNADACFSVIAFVALDSNNCAYLMDLRVGRWDPYKFVTELFSCYDVWSSRSNVHKVMMEDIALNRTFEAMIKDEQRKRGVRFHIEKIKKGGAGATAASKEQRIARLHGRFEDSRFVVVNDYMPSHYTDGSKRKELWNPTGTKEKPGWPSQPTGELVNQFIRFPVYTHNDIADAIADIDAVDTKGRRYCNGAGDSGPEDGFGYGNMRPRKGGPRPMGPTGKDKWSTLARRVGRKHG